jgi:acyl-CoA synthetase (AMP-forming)/AMP-acid ligase II
MNAAGPNDTVYERFARQARRVPHADALLFGADVWTYTKLLEHVERCARGLREMGVHRGMRVAVLSENRPEYTIVQLAAAKLGAMVACLNWRLPTEELRDSISLVRPHVLAYSARFAAVAAQLHGKTVHAIEIESLCPESGPIDDAAAEAQPADGLLIIFTSGTTGRPRAAVISHRAQIARMSLLQRDLGLDADDAYVAWSPMFHMGGSEHTLSSLMYGASAVICDGLDVAAITHAMVSRKIGWLLLVPATIDPLLVELERTRASVAGIKAVGCMADLVPAATIDALCKRVSAPFLNSFGSTETGLPPLSGHLLPVGDPLTDLSKRMNSGCELRLVDPSGHDVVDGSVGEAWVRGPTLFSGYWNRDAIDGSCFRGGWYPMGDLFRRTPSGGYQFVGRSKYLIKSGGENIYPAEIERILLDDPRVDDAVVVRKPDAKWGEVPVAFVVRRDARLNAADIDELCRAHLAGYKRPKAVHFIDAPIMPRSATGKIIREQLEVMARDD